MVDLLPCPYCGKGDLICRKDELSDDDICISCRSCGTNGPGAGLLTAADAWNRRAPLTPAAKPSPAAETISNLLERMQDGSLTSKDVLLAALRDRSPASAGGLADRVAAAIIEAMVVSDRAAACAAIYEVAVWLDQRGQHGCSLWLREEADR